MKANIIFVSMIAVLVVLTGATVLSGCGNPTGGGGGGGGSSPAIKYYIWVSTTTGSDDAGYGTSETHAYKTITHALSVARSKTLIRVMDGTYAEHLSWPTFEAIYISGESRDGTIISGDASGVCITFPSTSATNQTITIQSLTINNGSSTGSGGGIYIHQTGITVHLKNVVLANNNSTGGGVNGGGAIYGAYQDDNVIAEYCTFEGNSAGYGGAILLSHGTLPSGGYLSANNCIFSNNSAAIEGGAIYLPYITLEACSLSGNQVTSAVYADSGAAYVSYGGTMTNCLFYNNKVNTGASQGLGGAIRQPNTSGLALTITNCTFASNEVISSNIASGSGAIDGYAQTKLTNCILWGNNATTDPQLNNTSVVNYSDVQGGYTGTSTRNVDIDPAFFAGSGPYSNPSDLALTGSSTTDVTQGGTFSGAPTKDYAGTHRSGHISMGAYQY